jgi:hypothetical protein
MEASTAWPAFIMSITLRGLASDLTISSIEWAPRMFFPLARPLIKRSTFSVERLYAVTVNPLLPYLKSGFRP